MFLILISVVMESRLFRLIFCMSSHGDEKLITVEKLMSEDFIE